MMDFGDCIHSLTSDTLHRTLSPCFRCSPGLLSEYCFLPVFILLHHSKTTTEIWAACPYTSLCRHFPISRCTFLPFNKISTTAASLFFLCKDSPARALQVPVGTPYLCTKFQHAFRIFFFTPCRTVAKQNVVFQNFPGYSLHFALSTVGSYMHVKITKAQCFNL